MEEVHNTIDSEIHLIENIDAEGYLVNESDSDVETEKRIDVDVDYEIGKEEGNDVVGKVFNTPDDAYNFYNRHAFLRGFGIRKYSTFKNKTTNESYRKRYVCNKEGFKDMSSKSSNGDVKKRRMDLRTGCKAFLRISKDKDGKWSVDEFEDIHNHELIATPSKVMKHRSHGKFHRSLTCKALASELSQSGLKPCQIKKVVNTMKSPFENDVTSKQCSDILADQRKQYKGKEFYGLIKHFQDKILEDKNMYFVVDLFEDGSPRNIFWADGRSRDSYIKFGDVVVFDVTYMTNKFKMPFAPIVGVNHHGQSILFGGALLENEKQDTFEWLFQQFLKCMFERYPSAIITDQDKAICNAIKKVFPKTRHRYCSWHIKTMNSKPVLSSVNLIEAKASTRYTRKLFDVFKKEWTEATSNLSHETISKSLKEIIYKVGQLDIDKRYWREVIFRLSDKLDVTCSCAKFETYGILCKHILYVLKKRHVETLPDHYILPRWTLDARFKSNKSTIGLEDVHSGNEVSELTLWYVQSNFRKAIEQARDSASEIKKLDTILLKFLEEQSIRIKAKPVESAAQVFDVQSSQINMMPQISIRDPQINTNTKGRPKSATRIKSSLEAPKKRSCSYCNEKGHYINRCPKKKSLPAEPEG